MADENENTSGLPDWSKCVVMQSVSLQDVTIPPAIIEMVPESVARENVVIPLSQEDGVLRIVVHDPSDLDTMQKLQFILKKTIQPVLAPKEQIVEATNRHYGLG
jgi:type IV pilus assembly protein PilB